MRHTGAKKANKADTADVSYPVRCCRTGLTLEDDACTAERLNRVVLPTAQLRAVLTN
jgi:hypothetical protein